MEFVAVSKSVRISPRKIRLVASALGRNVVVKKALTKLALARKRSSVAIEKTLQSAIANAVHNGKLKEEDLILKRLDVMEGTPLKRYHPSTRGRVHPYKKRSSHIRVVVEGQTYGTKS